jgi:long-chain acyl-CoA synthetase
MLAPPIQWLLDAAAKRPGALAIRTGDARWTFERLADEVLRTAAVLADQDFEPNARIGLVFGSGPAYVTSLLGTLAAGFAAVPLSPLFTPREYGAHIRRNGLAAMITDPANSRACHAAMAETAADKQVLTIGESRFGRDIANAIAAASSGAAAAVSADDASVVLHTAGATGRSKLVPRTHRQVAAECDSIAKSISTIPDDVIFGILPLYHCHGLFNCLFAALRAQCALSLFLDTRPFVLARDDLLAAMVRDRATIVPSIPFQLERLLHTRERYDLSSVRLCYTGGAALRAEVYRAFRDRFDVAIRQQYGCTEAGAVTLNLDEDIDASAATAGKPLAGVSVAVIDADESGEGEIFISGAALTSGYEGMDELNAQVFVDGGFRTGDLGRIDSGGNLIVTRRRAVYIDVAGHKVDSKEVEDVLNEMPGVRETLVMATNAVPAAMKAVIACASPLDTRIVRDFCRERLASYKVPSVFEYCDELPRSELGNPDLRIAR